MPTDLADFLTLEREHRQAKKWFIFAGPVRNDKGAVVNVQIKSFGFYNQILHIDDSVNLASGHSIDKVGKMHAFLSEEINRVDP